MTRALALGFALLTAACGGKSFESLCTTQVPAPAGCNTACDPAPGATNSCPSGYHCAADGKCDLVCTATGNECGNGYSCTTDGYCQNTGNNPPPPDSNCPAVHVTATPTTPSIQLLIDDSGSMANNFADRRPQNGDPVKYTTVRSALVGPAGVITQLEQSVYFGASLMTDDAVCPRLYSVPRAKANKGAIDTLIGSRAPAGNTPSPPSIDKVVADFAANPPPTGSPPVIVFATDGLPNACGDPNADTRAQSVAAAANAYKAGIRLYILGVGTIAGAAQHLQDMANAGAGVKPGQPNAKAYTALSPAELSAAFAEIIGGVVSCDLTLNGHVDPANAASGTVTVNGNTLNQGTDWTLDNDGLHIHILGAACATLKGLANPVVDASFSCGSVIF
jgi:hypothetical protein